MGSERQKLITHGGNERYVDQILLMQIRPVRFDVCRRRRPSEKLDNVNPNLGLEIRQILCGHGPGRRLCDYQAMVKR